MEIPKDDDGLRLMFKQTNDQGLNSRLKKYVARSSENIAKDFKFAGNPKLIFTEKHLKNPAGIQEWVDAMNEMVYRRDKMWTCKQCDYQDKHKISFTNHIESAHTPEHLTGFQCSRCKVMVKHRMNFLIHFTK